jgi:predicted nucleotidyltransferase
MADAKQIERVAATIAAATDAERVILFGSHARGDAGPSSDVDLMVIAESALPRHKRARALHAMFRPYPFGMDLLVYTPQEVERAARSPLSFVSGVLREGKAVYVRRH